MRKIACSMHMRNPFWCPQLHLSPKIEKNLRKIWKKNKKHSNYVWKYCKPAQVFGEQIVIYKIYH